MCGRARASLGHEAVAEAVPGCALDDWVDRERYARGVTEALAPGPDILLVGGGVTPNPADKPRVYPVEKTYGGPVYKQRYLLRVGNATFPFLQYNTEGKDAYADRTRKPWRDYHGDWL